MVHSANDTNVHAAYSRTVRGRAMLVLFSNNGQIPISLHNGNWVTICFIVTVNGVDYSSTASAVSHGVSLGTVNTAAYMCVPVYGGDNVKISWQGIGAACNMDANVYLGPL